MKNALSLARHRKLIRHFYFCECGNRKSPKDLVCPKCNVDLENNIIARSMPWGNALTPDRETVRKVLLKHAKEVGIGPVGTCAICGGHYIWGGNNPYPVITDKDARCCTRCDNAVVIPARIDEMITKTAKQVLDTDGSEHITT